MSSNEWNEWVVISYPWHAEGNPVVDRYFGTCEEATSRALEMLVEDDEPSIIAKVETTVHRSCPYPIGAE